MLDIGFAKIIVTCLVENSAYMYSKLRSIKLSHNFASYLNERDSLSQGDYNVTYRNNKIGQKAKCESSLKQIKKSNKSNKSHMKKIPETWWSKARKQGMTEEAKARTAKLLHTSFFIEHIYKHINRKK